jgi:ABC-type dipeptide/oligopeptide/nickel transport system permease subunit
VAVSQSLPTRIRVAAPEAPGPALARQSRTYLREVASQLARNHTAMIGIGFIVLLIAVAILTPLIAPYDYAQGSLLQANKPPSSAHWLGTDALGRDELTRLMWGARVSLTVAIGAQIIIMVIGVTLGLISGFSVAGRITSLCAS